MNISGNNPNNHINKNSCVLYSSNIRQIYYKVKEKTNSQNYNNYNNIISRTKVNNITSRSNISLNNKPLIEKTNTSLFQRPYIKQLSQYSFLTSKTKNSKDNISLPKLDGTNNYENSEKDDKTNIYFNLIKTYYDENGKKLKIKKNEIYPIDNEIDFPNKLKNKKKKKKNNNNKKNYEQNKIMNTDCNAYYTILSKDNDNFNKDKSKDLQRFLIKRENKDVSRKKTSSFNKCIYNNNKKEIIASPCNSEKSYNIFFQNKSGDFIINDIKKNPLINNRNDFFKNNDYLNNNDNSSLSKKANISNISFSKDKEKNINKNLSNIIEYFNKRICGHQFIPIKTIGAIKISPQLNSSSFNTLNNHRSNKCIFHKKKISDLSINNKYFNLQKSNKKDEDDRPLSDITHVDSFESLKQKLKKEHISCKNNISHHNMILACDIFNNNYNINLNNMKISPKNLEKYFNPNQISKENLSFKNKYIKIPEEKENIDINNITFKKPFFLSKNIKMRNIMV